MNSSAVLYDFETCSAADLRSVGGRNYAQHESTRVLIGCFLIDGVFHVWLPGQDISLPCFSDLWPKQFGERRKVVLHGSSQLPYEVMEHARYPSSPEPESSLFIAHNGDAFDSHIWREKLSPVPVNWGDTIHSCRAAGLPASLEELGKRFFGFGKDPGQAIMSRLWKLEGEETKWGRRYYNKNQTPGNIAAAARYCIADVCILEKVYAATLGFGEPNVIQVHRSINDRGVQFDTVLARKLIDMSNRAAQEAGEKIEQLTNGTLRREDLRSQPKMKAWLKANGVELANLRKNTVNQLLDDPDSFLQEIEDHGD